MTRRAFGLMLALLLIAAVVGCGDGGDGSDATGSAEQGVFIPWGPSEAYYVERANGVCRQSWDDMLSSYAQRYQRASRGQRFDEAAQNIFLPSIQLWFDNISFLGAPTDDKAQIEDILTAMQLAVFSGQEQTVTSPNELEAIFAEFNQLARQYKLNKCLVEEASFTKNPSRL